MSYRHHKKWRKKYRTPRKKQGTNPDLLLRGSDASINLLYFEYLDTGYVNVVNSPPNLVWTFDPDTGELTVEDLFNKNTVYDFYYGDDIGHVLREMHETN